MDFNKPYLRFKERPSALLDVAGGAGGMIKALTESNSITAVQIDGKYFKPVMELVNKMYVRDKKTIKHFGLSENYTSLEKYTVSEKTHLSNQP